ncbi:MAG: MFS transporter, partial [Anaerolineales bacterium]
LAAWLISIVALIWLALAPDWRWAIPGFALFFISSFARPALSGYVAASDKSGDIGRTFAAVFSGYWIGSILAPALGGWIGEHVGLRAVLWCSAGFNLISTLFLARLTDLKAAPRARAADPRRLLTDRAFLWHLFVFLLMFFALDVGVVLAPNYLQAAKGLRLEQIGQLGAAASLGSIILSYWLGQMRAEGLRSLLLTQLAVMLALMLLLALPAFTVGPGFYPVFFLAYFLRGGVNTTWTLTSSRLSRWLEPEVLSLGFGFRDTITRLALIASPFVAGQLYERSPALPLYFGLMAIGLTSLLTFSLPRGRRQVSQTLATAAEPEPSTSTT